jgi:hypothetical protein
MLQLESTAPAPSTQGQRLILPARHLRRSRLCEAKVCGKSVLGCEDQKIGILIFCAGCCGLATGKELIDAGKAHDSIIRDRLL